MIQILPSYNKIFFHVSFQFLPEYIPNFNLAVIIAETQFIFWVFLLYVFRLLLNFCHYPF